MFTGVFSDPVNPHKSRKTIQKRPWTPKSPSADLSVARHRHRLAAAPALAADTVGTTTIGLMEITVEIPGALAGRPTDELAIRARLLLVIDEVRAGRLTRAGAARALDMSLDDFLIEAGRHGLEAIDYDVEDFKRELGAIRTKTR